MNNLMTSMLYQFHYHILDPGSGVRFSVMDLLQSVRAVRDVSWCGVSADDSVYIRTRGGCGGTTSGRRRQS